MNIKIQILELWKNLGEEVRITKPSRLYAYIIVKIITISKIFRNIYRVTCFSFLT